MSRPRSARTPRRAGGYLGTFARRAAPYGAVLSSHGATAGTRAARSCVRPGGPVRRDTKPCRQDRLGRPRGAPLSNHPPARHDCPGSTGRAILAPVPRLSDRGPASGARHARTGAPPFLISTRDALNPLWTISDMSGGAGAHTRRGSASDLEIGQRTGSCEAFGNAISRARVFGFDFLKKFGRACRSCWLAFQRNRGWFEGGQASRRREANRRVIARDASCLVIPAGISIP